MKKHLGIFLLLLATFSLGNKAKCESGNSLTKSTFVISSIGDSFSNPFSDMKGENNSHNEYTIMLFRKGIDEKRIVITYNGIEYIIRDTEPVEEVLAENARVKYWLSYSSFLELTPQFRSAFSSHAPPLFC